MGAIFISYRREDTEGHAGRLFEDLRAAFGDDSVFMDVAGIEPGKDFRKVIDTKVASCSVLLCLIGRHWLGVKDTKGRSRLDDPADFVRLETGSALRRDISVVPVLVHGATMPTQDDLPADLKELAFRNGVELTHARWDSDMQVLITALRKQMSLSSEEGAAAVTPAPRRARGTGGAVAAPARSRSVAVIGVLVAAVLAGGGFYAYRAQQERAAKALEAERGVAPAADPRLAVQGFGTNGYKVRSVSFDDGNGTTLGQYKQSAAGRWVETGPSGSDIRFQFAETGRDEWSVYLSEASSDKRLQLDLNTRKVLYATGANPMRAMYRIVMAQ
jgi:TIR domain